MFVGSGSRRASDEASDDGFILLETLVAVLVLSLGLAGAIAAVQASLGAQGRAEELASRGRFLNEVTAEAVAAWLSGTGRHIASGQRRGGAWRTIQRRIPRNGRGEQVPPVLIETVVFPESGKGVARGTVVVLPRGYAR